MSELCEAVEAAKVAFVQAKDRFLHGLATTPDEYLNWSPTPTARTPIQIAAHAADSVKHIHGTLDGRTFPVPTTAEAEAGFREWEKQFSTRDAVLELLEAHGSAYLEWLDELTPAQFESMVEIPYKLGFMPMRVGLTVQAQHLNWHAAQLDYVQTAYGDHDWHIGV